MNILHLFKPQPSPKTLLAQLAEKRIKEALQQEDADILQVLTNHVAEAGELETDEEIMNYLEKQDA